MRRRIRGFTSGGIGIDSVDACVLEADLPIAENQCDRVTRVLFGRIHDHRACFEFYPACWSNRSKACEWSSSRPSARKRRGEEQFRIPLRGAQFASLWHAREFTQMRFQRLAAQVVRPFEIVDDAGMSRDYGSGDVADCRRNQRRARSNTHERPTSQYALAAEYVPLSAPRQVELSCLQ